MTNVAIILSGCGVFDGSEIHEAVLALLALDKAGAHYECFAPDINQHHVINHLTQEESSETRNVLVESARIARGNIKPLSEANPEHFDAALFPGGFGAAKNLSDFAFKGSDCEIHPEVVRFIQALHTANKPCGFICIAPAMIPKLLGEPIECTIGNDIDTANAINRMGGQHKECAATDCIIDEKHKIVSTPAYMLAQRISEAAEGIDKTVNALLKLAQSNPA